MSAGSLPLVLDFLGVFAFALNGALTAIGTARLDIVGIITLAMITALGGGIVRDILLGVAPPVTFRDWRYLVVATVGGLLAFAFSRQLVKVVPLISGSRRSGFEPVRCHRCSDRGGPGSGPWPSRILGVITGAGGGTIRDMMLAQVPSMLRSGLYAIPALLAATITVAAIGLGIYGIPSALVAAGSCFALRMLGVHYNWHVACTQATPNQDTANGISEPPRILRELCL